MLPPSFASQILQLEVGGISDSIVTFVLLLSILWYVGVALTFKKANQPPWAAVIPIYNFYVMLRIGGNAWWWLLIILFVPVLNVYGLYRMFVDVAKAFDQGIGFGLGLFFLGPIFWLWLAVGSFQYQGPRA